MIKIRQAEEVDLPEIMKLYELLFAYSATLQPDYFQAAGQQYDFFARYADGAAVSGARAQNSRYGVGADTTDSAVYLSCTSSVCVFDGFGCPTRTEKSGSCHCTVGSCETMGSSK